MMTSIAAALAAAQPAVSADANAQNAPMMQMRDERAGQRHGQMAEMMKCCKHMMSKMHEGRRAPHEGDKGE